MVCYELSMIKNYAFGRIKQGILKPYNAIYEKGFLKIS